MDDPSDPESAAQASLAQERFLHEVLSGLAERPRSIPARFLYDARGSALFDQICELPEYYLTRTETGILAQRAAEFARLAGPGCVLVEFGSGSSTKSRLLIDAMDIAVYVPIDISRSHLDRTATQLRLDYPDLSVRPVAADFMRVAELPADIDGDGRRIGRRRIGFFPGSTIGNLTPVESHAFLRRARHLVGDNGAMLIGIDLRKDPRVLDAAYNDAAGVTARFTLNLLHRINRELDADFEIDAFRHDAFYNEQEGRIEVYIRSLRRQTVTVAGRSFDLDAEERIHTEYSYKYDPVEFAERAHDAGLRLTGLWTDPARLFAVVWLDAA